MRTPSTAPSAAQPAALPAKVFYRPIEAAIRWSGLLPHETTILDQLADRQQLEAQDFPRWPLLRLNLARLYDAFHNGELPYGKNGINCADPSLLTQPDLTVRHVNLKAWMSRYYPDQKPEFLFEDIERQLCPAISLDHMQVLLADREALKLRLNELQRSYQHLHKQHGQLSRQAARLNDEHPPLPARSESTYLSIVGGLLTLLLGKSPGGQPYSTFTTTEAIISTLQAWFPGQPGLSERTLWQKFSEARRHLELERD